MWDVSETGGLLLTAQVAYYIQRSIFFKYKKTMILRCSIKELLPPPSCPTLHPPPSTPPPPAAAVLTAGRDYGGAKSNPDFLKALPGLLSDN